MTFDDYWAVLRRSWVFVLACAALGGLLGFGLSKAMTPVYQSQATVIVSMDRLGLATSELTVDQRMAAFGLLATDEEVLSRAAAGLPPEIATDVDLDAVAVTVDSTNPVLTVTATAGSGPEAAALADAVAREAAVEISKRGSRDFGSITGPDGRQQSSRAIVAAEVATPASVPTDPISPKVRTNTGLGLMLGLVLGVGLTLLYASAVPKIRSEADLAEGAGPPFLGSLGAGDEDYALVRAALIAQNDLAAPVAFVVTGVAADDVSPIASGLASALQRDGATVLLADSNAGEASELAELKQRYDWIVIEADPVTASPQAVLTCGAADGAVVVVQAHRTRLKDAKDAIDVLHRTGARVLGTLLV